ncbi:MAG TPA: vanadium-dependent haloperoxidase [Longimicrobium sp.]|nr:vanadium-dependent haloperoxidase [Longimicrobium sp.]
MAKAHTLVDTFNDDSRDTTKWTLFTTTATVPADRIREVNGRVEVRPAGNASSDYAHYASAVAYDLTDSEVSVELVQALRPIGGTLTYLSASKDAGNEVDVHVTVGSVGAWQRVAGTGSYLVLVPYDPARHRWLRLRQREATTYWETSPDGMTWEVLHSRANPFALTAVTLEFGAGTRTPTPSPGMAVFDNFNTPDTSRARRIEERRLSARDVRMEAAELAAARRHDEHANNNDEVNYPTRPYTGSYSKSLKHDALGDPDPASYGSLLRALQSEDPHDFEEIQLASATAVKLTNPQSGLAFDVEGPDAQEVTQPPAPRFDSEVTAHEMGELYWMAVARDVHFAAYGSDPAIAAATASLNAEFPQFGGTVPVTAQNVFRGIYPGEQVGPYVSQLLWKGNVDPRKPNGLGRDADEGFISYGSRVIDQRLIPAAEAVDWLTDFGSWLNAQNGVDARGQDIFDTQRRFIRSLRDGATFVHFDQVIDAWYNAAWILMSEPTGNQLAFQPGVTGRPQIDAEFPKDPGNPYDPPGTAMDSRTQVGFGTFGPIHLLQVLTEVLGRAIRAVWWQKWGVHRRLRPEEFGGRVDNHLQGRRTYPIHASLLTSLQSGGLAPYYGDEGERFALSYLLPQAYPEGAPTHPAYGAGHSTGSGACATILKAFFDESKAIENPVVSSADGLTLVPYAGADAAQMTVGGEINKLAGNISLFRNAAGVHWRSDYTESVLLGEAVAIRLLQEMSLGFNEDDAFFELTKFNGQKIRVFDGKVVAVQP